MAEVHQKEIGDPHSGEGIHAPQDDDDAEVIIGGDGPSRMAIKEWMMLDQKVTMAMVTWCKETPKFIPIDLGDLEWSVFYVMSQTYRISGLCP